MYGTGEGPRLVVYGLVGNGAPGTLDEVVLDFIEQSGVSFPVMYDADGTYSEYDRSEATAPYPLDVIVDPDGVVAYVAAEYDPDAMAAVIDGLLQE